MAYWLIKSDPEKMSFADLAMESYEGYEWSGVRDEDAFDHFAAMQPGDLAFFYHTGIEHRFYGIVRIKSAAHPDSTDDSGQWLAADIAVFLRLISRVPLSTLKQQEAWADFAERVVSGPDIQPVSTEEWATICQLADMPKLPE